MTGTLQSTGSLLFINAGYPQCNNWASNYNGSIATGERILLCNGNPSGLIWCPVSSGIAYDVTGGSLYMFGGSPTDWWALGSVAY